MDAIIGLGHFCESHGPCIILTTQRCQEEVHQCPATLKTPCCESCQSIDPDQSLVSKDETTFYITTRVPLRQNLALLLKQAAVRSLSCEETSKEGGTMYFGDNERGHVISHTFTLQDSLARGFHRKYSILILMCDKVHLLNCWPILTKNIKDLALDLQNKAIKINAAEQAQCFQRALRHAQGSPTSPARSLSQLTGEPAIFGHLHMWFTWLISIEPVVEKPNATAEVPITCDPDNLRLLYNELDKNTFKTLCYCVLTGIRIEGDTRIIDTLAQLLPNNFHLAMCGESCKIVKTDGSYSAVWNGSLPSKLPTLLSLVEDALSNKALQGAALKHHLTSAIFHWKNISMVLSGVVAPNQALFQALGVQKCDMPLLAYWTSQCREESYKNC